MLCTIKRCGFVSSFADESNRMKFLFELYKK
jgi:hypothetical protein